MIHHSTETCGSYLAKNWASVLYLKIIRSPDNLGTPSMQLLGVYDEYLVEPLAQVLINLGVKRGMVVYGRGAGKLDETSLECSYYNL